MLDLDDYPGTPRHQALLRAIVSYYRDDPRVLAVSVFGSLSRGDWDQFSDLDLDIVVVDGTQLDAVEELHLLCRELAVSIGEKSAVIVPYWEDAGDVLFESLMQLSVRFHPIETTNPKIVDSLQVLTSEIDSTSIVAAGVANRPEQHKRLPLLLDMSVRYVAVADVNLQRRHIWEAIEMLHRMRGLFMELYSLARGGERPMEFFQANASAKLQTQLGRTLPEYSLDSVQTSLGQCLGILKHDLGQLTKGQVQLTDAHRSVLNSILARQDALRA